LPKGCMPTVMDILRSNIHFRYYSNLIVDTFNVGNLSLHRNVDFQKLLLK